MFWKSIFKNKNKQQEKYLKRRLFSKLFKQNAERYLWTTDFDISYI